MKSSCNSPVTPTLRQQQSSLMQRVCSSKSKGVPLTSKVVAEDSDSFWNPQLSSDVEAACKNSLRSLRSKMSMPDVIDREFLSLATKQDSTSLKEFSAMQAALSKKNRDKNRYIDVLPFDNTRVILHPTKASGSDYINASFIEDASDKPRVFIAAQGPLKSTTVDFWEMVMQFRCSAIIMLTSLVEGNMEKCAPYFPMAVDQQQIYGRLKVANKRLTVSRHSIAKRVLEVQSVEGRDPPLNVLHFEYLHWPDHGLPPSTRVIREIFRCLNNLPQETGPVVVHCSAGIGRSGTYITIDESLRRILNGDTTEVDVQGTVHRLREQRSGMVQTRAQYHFCYAAIADELEELLTKKSHSKVVVDG